MSREIPVCQLKAGTVITYSGTEFKAWRVLRAEQPLSGWGVVATRQDQAGFWDGPVSLLIFANDNAVAVGVPS